MSARTATVLLGLAYLACLIAAGVLAFTKGGNA